MNLIRITFIIFISVFMNLNVLAAPTHVTEFDISGQEPVATGITFNSNGTKMFIVGIDNTNGEEINEYSLSVAYDLSSTVTHLGEFRINGSTSVPQDVAFNANGTEVFVVSANGEIFSWTLATAYDVSNPTANHDINLGGNLRGLKFNTDGSKMFVYNATNDSVVEYTLSTAYDPSTRSSTTVSYESTVITRDQQGMAFSSDGTKMYLVEGRVGGAANFIAEYNLSIGYDLSSTITHVGTYEVNVDADTESISGLTFNTDGSKMFHTDFTKDAVQEYTLDCGFGLIQCINPTDDEDDVASVEVQSEVSKKLIQHTTFPVLNRMEWLRRNKNSNNLTNQNIKFQFSNEILASLSNLIIPIYLSSDNSSTAEPQFGNWSYWSEGTISIGKVGDSTTSSAKNINTSAITIGADRKNNKNRMYGFAFRFGSDDIDVGNLGSALDMNALSLTIYETRPSGKNMFMDSLIGISAINTNLLNNSGSISTDGKREGKQIFSSIKFRETFTKEKLNITPNIKIDLGFTSLSDYTETGADGLNLKFKRQDIGTIITSIGSVIDNTIDINNGIIKPNIQLEYNADISPSSKQEFEYASNGTSYILENINSSTHNYRGSFGFDFITDNGLSLTTNYERNQSKGSGHTDTIYFAGSYVSKSDETYTFILNGSETFNTKLDYKRNINGFDITFGSNYSLMSQIPDYGATIEVVSTF